MIQVFISNTDTDDLFASVTDLNTLPPSVPLVVSVRGTPPATNQRINAGANVTVSVQEDGTGNCLLQIVTVSTDATKTKTFNNQSCIAQGTIPVDLFGA
jgi:hypothetical protein